MVVVAAVLIGLVLGSFLSVLVARWPAWQGVISGRSECPNCGHVLRWYELLPLISWFIQRGKCADCGKPISGWYPTYEVLMALTLGIYAARFGADSWWALTDIAILFYLVALFFFDLRKFILPDVFTLTLSGLALLRLVVLNPGDIRMAVITGFVLAMAFASLFVLSRGRWLGFGDVKLALAMGLIFSAPDAITVTFAAIWGGALLGIALMLARRAGRTTPLPLGAFWTLAAIIAILWPEALRTLSGIFFPL